MADVTDGSIASWGQTGAVVAFAGAVLWELKQLRPLIKSWIDERKEDRALTAEIKQVLAQLLERERMRSEQRNQLLRRKAETDPPIDASWDDLTDQVAVPSQRQPKQRARTDPYGQPSTYGPMTPKKER